MSFSTLVYKCAKQGENDNNGEENVEDFLKSLYREVIVENRWSSEISDLKSAVKEMVENFIIEAFEGKKRSETLKSCLKPVGSMEDGTSIGKPDEFDFILEVPDDHFVAQPSVIQETIKYPVNSCPRLVIKPGDKRFRRLFRNQTEMSSKDFIHYFETRFTNAVLALSQADPVRRGEYRLHMRHPKSEDCFTGFQGPAFHLHNHLAWISPSGQGHLVSIDLVPVVVMEDEKLCKQVPKFRDNDTNACELTFPSKYYLIPMKSRYVALSNRVSFQDDTKAKQNFALYNYAVSLTQYENNIMKKWKCEQSAYHYWYICYILMKCFGTIAHTCSNYTNIEVYQSSITSCKPISFPERNETLSSYAWKLLIFDQAKKYEGKRLSLHTCLYSLLSMFLTSSQSSAPSLTINSFWCQEVAETVYLQQKDSDQCTELVDKMTKLNTLIREIYHDGRYDYDVYKNKLGKIFPELEEVLSTPRH